MTATDVSVQVGTRLGPYEILAAIGAGGMGEVFRARDTRLGRDVAIKVLPPHLSGDSEFQLRFQREARAISSLNHPNICTLHDVGEDFLVMEYCEGESLADRLERGALPVEQALRVAIEIAGALVCAHRGGIVHRDLKPGNIMLTKSGAKLLDFGLAKPSSMAGRGMDATARMPLTAVGMVVGTFQYMAPEQLAGAEVDARTDLFAFGAVLYEMLTGNCAFEGTSQASIIAAILERQPQPISAIRPLTPPALERVVRVALEKDPDDRWQTAHDLQLELRWIAEAGSQAGVPAPLAIHRKNRERLAWALASIALIAAIAAAGALFVAGKKPVRAMWTQINNPPEAAFSYLLDDVLSLAISPDGRRLVFAAAGEDNIRRLWMRRLDSLEAKALPGTEGAISPFWSPDSRMLAFFAESKLKKIDVEGGPPLTICEVGVNPRGGSWNRDGVILFAPTSLTGIHRVPASGGRPEPVTKLTPEESTHRSAVFLPDQKHFLYFAGAHSSTTQSEKNAVYAGSLDGRTKKLLLHTRSNAVYASGYLLWAREGSLVAQRFDADALELEGQPAVVAPKVRVSPDFFYATFSVSNDGTLVYANAADVRFPLGWYDLSGKRLGDAVTEPQDWFGFVLASDGKRLAASIFDPVLSTTDVWVYDLERGTRMKLTDSPADEFATIWSPDGKRIAYTCNVVSQSVADLCVKSASGEGEQETLLTSPVSKQPWGWSPDGRYLSFAASKPDDPKADIWILDLNERKATPFIESSAFETLALFSPAGKWLLYARIENGTARLFVTSFPERGRSWQIGPADIQWGGWVRGGRELMYATSKGDIYSVEVLESGNTFNTGVPKLLARVPQFVTGPADFAPDGERLLMVERPPAADNAPINIVTNWTAIVK